MPQQPEDLRDHLAVRYASPSTGRIEDWEWEENGETRRLSLRARVTVNSAEAQIACCIAGLGLIQIPAYDVKHHLRCGELVAVMPNYRASPLSMTLLHPHRQFSSRRLKVFADWLQDLLKRQIAA